MGTRLCTNQSLGVSTLRTLVSQHLILVIFTCFDAMSCQSVLSAVYWPCMTLKITFVTVHTSTVVAQFGCVYFPSILLSGLDYHFYRGEIYATTANRNLSHMRVNLMSSGEELRLEILSGT